MQIVQIRELTVTATVRQPVAPNGGNARVFYLPGGKPEAGECAEQTLNRELSEELGVVPIDLMLLGQVEEIAAVENAPMQMTVFTGGRRAGWDTRTPPTWAASAAARHRQRCDHFYYHTTNHSMYV
jgi:8-oxo-dGTP pyrophosphatase MutT (NUDIX family)